MGLTEAEDIKKRWKEYRELYKKDLHNPDNHDGVITHLEPNILECEVKWALGSITAKTVIPSSETDYHSSQDAGKEEFESCFSSVQSLSRV